MIFFLLCRAGNHTIRDSYLYEFPGVAERVRAFNYEGVFIRRQLPGGCYVFTDLERVTPEAMRSVSAFYDHLGRLGPRVRRLNHPTRSLMRYDLLRTMFRQGINDFDVYRVSEERRPQRYPVFLRREDDHEGPVSLLLKDAQSLEGAIRQALARGNPRDRLLIVEFCDVADERRIFRKYGAFYVNGTVVPRHLVIAKHWVAKFTDFRKIEPFVPIDEQIREEARYVAENPHEKQIRSVFEAARIDYGRIDYSLKDGDIRVWEINTNPVIAEARNIDGGPRHRLVLEPGVRRLSEAILALDEGLPVGRFRIEPTIRERMGGAPPPAR